MITSWLKSLIGGDGGESNDSDAFIGDVLEVIVFLEAKEGDAFDEE